MLLRIHAAFLGFAISTVAFGAGDKVNAPPAGKASADESAGTADTDTSGDAKPSPRPIRSETFGKPEQAASGAASTSADVRELFNGRDLSGWTVHEGSEESWAAIDERIRCSRPGGGWLRTTEVFSDFELEFEYRLAEGANTGVGLRFPDAGSPTLTGIEIQLLDDAAPQFADLRPDQYSGSLYYQIPARERAGKPAGEWNTARIVACGTRIDVTLNGQLVNKVDLATAGPDGKPHRLCERPPLGHIGFQSHSRTVEFRRVRLRDLTRTLDEQVRVADLEEGSGEACAPGDKVTVDYVGRFVDGKKFDSSADQGGPVTVSLDKVISGWKIGIPGMKVGGRRKLIVPPDQAYGSQGVGEIVPPDSTLVFEVELRGVEH